MAMNAHERVEELVALRELGGSTGEDDAELDRLWADHGSSCEQCRRVEAETREVAGRLAFALDPAPVREELEEELLERIGEPAGVERARPGGLRRSIAAVAAAVLVVAGGLGGYLLAPRQSGPSAQLATFLADGARIAQFQGSSKGVLAVAWRPGEDSAFVVGSNLAAPPPGKVYELWTFRGNRPPIPSGTFTPSGAQTIVHLDRDLGGAKQMAVTVEKAPGAPQPTTNPIFVAPISSV